MMALFQQEFSCRSIVFTTTPSILELCTTLGLTTSYDIQENPYGIPYIGSLFQRAASLFDAHFYGYINADILLSPKIFSILPLIMEHKRQNFPTRMVFLSFLSPSNRSSSSATILSTPPFPISKTRSRSPPMNMLSTSS